jgi:hypothetical protein
MDLGSSGPYGENKTKMGQEKEEKRKEKGKFKVNGTIYSPGGI